MRVNDTCDQILHSSSDGMSTSDTVENDADPAVTITKISLEDITDIRDATYGLDEPGNDVFATSSVRGRKNPNSSNTKKFGEYSIVLRRIMYDVGGVLKQIKMVLEIQSDRLRKAFRTLCGPEVHESMDLWNNPIKIEAPFHLIFHLRKDMKKFVESNPEADLVTREMNLLLEFIDTNPGLKEARDSYDRNFPKGLVTFESLWTIYPPGQIVVLNATGFRECYRCKSTSLDPDPMNRRLYVHVEGMNHDGTRFGKIEKQFSIPFFKGPRDIASLKIVPLEKVPNHEALLSHMVSRGRVFETLVAKHAHRDYTGTVWDYNECSGALVPEFTVKGQVVIDPSSLYEIRPRITPYLLSERDNPSPHYRMPPPPPPPPLRGRHNPRPYHPGFGNFPPPPPGIYAPNNSFNATRDLESVQCSNQLSPGADDMDYAMLPAHIPGFALQERRWGWFLVEQLSEINWRTDPFKNIEMDENRKSVIKALVKGHLDSSGLDFDDIVVGKGKGLIFLLHGPPGLGKTLTAEIISEHVRRPLYHVSSGELTTSVETMEKKVEAIFKLGKKWGAIVLIDEADVFLCKRELDSLERNSLVSVFLRLMEYYQGILFLTSNFGTLFDEAILDRVHLFIEFTPMTPELRARIWETMISSNVSATTPPEHPTWGSELYTALGQFDINGRTIKNLVRTAVSFAKAEGQFLSIRHLYVVMEINLKEHHHVQQLANLRMLAN